MAQNRSDNIQINAPKALDNKSGRFSAGSWRPYNDLDEFNLSQPLVGRPENLMFWVRSEVDPVKSDLYALDLNKSPYKILEQINLSNYYDKDEIDGFLSLKADLEYVDSRDQELENEISSKADSADINSPITITYADLVSNTYTNVLFSNQNAALIYYDTNGLQKVSVTFNNSGVITLPFTADLSFSGTLIGVTGALGNYVSNTTYNSFIKEQIITGANPLSLPAFGIASAWFVLNLPISESSPLLSISIYAFQAGTLIPASYTRSGNNFTRKAVGNPINIASAGLYTFMPQDFGQLNFEIGDLPGFNATSLLVGTKAGTTAPFFSGSTPNFTSSSENLINELQVHFTLNKTYITQELIRGIEESTIDSQEKNLALQTQSYIYQSVGYKDILTPGLGQGGMASGAVVIGTVSQGYGSSKRIQFLSLKNSTVTFCIFSRIGNVFTIESSVVKSVVIGVNIFDGDVLPIKKGQYTGFTTTEFGVACQLVVPIDGAGGFTSTTVVNGSFTGTPLASTVGIQCVFDLQVSDVAYKTNRLSLHNVDLIALSGDSYGTGYYQMIGKAWINKASLFSDFNWENYSVSGDTYASQLNRIRVNGTHYGGGRAWKDFGVVYGITQLGRNDQIQNVTPSQLEANASSLIQTIRGLGAIPIVATEWRTVYGASGVVLLKSIANKLKALFCDILPYTLSMNYGTPYAPFFALEHPGVRVSDILSESMESFSKKLGRPKKSLKIFRKRTGVAVGVIQDLMFDDNYDRAKLFKEINVGHYAMTDATAKYYDQIQNTANYTVSVVPSEYLAIRNNVTVSFADYGLIDAILPTISKNINSLFLVLNDPTIKVYCRDILGTPLQTNGTPQGTWVEIKPVNGVYLINDRVIDRYMKFDKISFLLYKSGGFNLTTAPYIDWVGAEGKPEYPSLEVFDNIPLGNELLSQTDCGTLVGWTVEGSVTPALPIDNMLPRGSTGMMVIDSVNKIRQTFSYPVNDYADQAVEIKMVCRRFPVIFDPSGDYSLAPVTSDTFDWTKGIIELIDGTQVMPYSGKVGLWWKELTFRTVLPIGLSSLDIRFSAIDSIQIASVSVKKV